MKGLLLWNKYELTFKDVWGANGCQDMLLRPPVSIGFRYLSVSPPAHVAVVSAQTQGLRRGEPWRMCVIRPNTGLVFTLAVCSCLPSSAVMRLGSRPLETSKMKEMETLSIKANIY